MDISSERLFYLIKISTMKFKEPIPIQELVKVIKISRANFTPIKKILMENGLAMESNTYGNTKLLRFHLRKLDDFITKTNLYIMISNYIKFKDPLLHQP